MSYHLIINDVELGYEFNTFDESISNFNDNTTQELVVSYNSTDQVAEITEVNFEQIQPFLNNNSISKIEIVDENKNTVFKTTAYSNITTAVKSGNTSGTPGMYSLSLRFMNNL